VTTPTVRVMIAGPLEEPLVERIAAEHGVELLWEPDLLPPARYPGDHAGDPGFRRDADGEARWAEMLAEAEVLFGIPGDTPAGLAVTVAAAPKLRWVQATSAGAGEQLRAAGLSQEDLDRVTMTTGAGVHAIPLAEFAILGMLVVVKDVPRLAADQGEHVWGPKRPAGELHGRTLFLLGLGNIGLEVARLAKAFGMRTVGFRRTPAGEPPRWTDELRGVDQLAATIGQADAVVVSLPGTPETSGMVSREVIARMRPECVFVNLGRGAVVDEQALTEALREHRIAGAVLDVFATEPLPSSSELWGLDNVLVSPHTAALSADENRRLVELFTGNLRAWLAGRPLRNVVRTDAWY
jgi:phosphoglycerate dehydrogenase-like enzyme